MNTTINDLRFKGARLPLENEYYWMENVIAREALPKKPDHDKEHVDMLLKWGCKPEHTSKLSMRFDEDGNPYMDRLYHVMLHLRYWKEEGILLEFVKKFEDQSKSNLDDLILPSPNSTGQELNY